MRLVLALAVLAAGCLSPAAPEEIQAASTEWPRGVHPWPTGDEWPQGLDGPFAVKEIFRATVPGAGGVPLDGWIWLPDVPEGVRVPVFLSSSPYHGQLYPTSDLRDLPVSFGAVPEAEWFVEHGYAAALFSVRGTGNSGGCFEMTGPNEQEDHELLVEWLAAEPWSNGRVGMTGGSYDGTTPWEAAIRNPPGLKTIVPVAPVTNFYTFYHTPQGAEFTEGWWFQTAYTGAVSLAPPLLGGPENAARHAPVLADRACPEVADVVLQLARGQHTDARDAAFWEPRRLIAGIPDVTASVFLAHGFDDHVGSGHQQEENAVWPLLSSPKRMIEGQWGHERPKRADWDAELLRWFDFWLKGLGDPPKVGVVDYEDSALRWRTTTAWPPAEAREEVHHLAPGAFRALPVPLGPERALCAEAAPWASVHVTDPLAGDALLAGNPLAWLNLTADAPGGQVAVHLYALPPAGCEGRFLSHGYADLRHHAGNYEGRDFPVGTPTGVRIDLTNPAEALAQGERLAAVVSYGWPEDREPSGKHAPNVRLEPGSHLVLPFVEGGLGGEAPTMEYPGRPFVPSADRGDENLD